MAEIRRVADLAPAGALTASVFRKHARVDVGAVRRRFGTWADALKAAGLTHRSSDSLGGAGNRASRRMSNEEVLETLRGLAARLGRATLTVDDVEQHLPFARETLSRRWGSSQAAFSAAGLVSSKGGRPYTDEECFENLLAVWTHYGRPPMRREMRLPPSRVGGEAYARRFGTWMKALAAFVDRINQDREPETDRQPATRQQPAAEVPRVMPPTRSSEHSREIRLGLRFRVLHRDRFKCVLCGDHPARNANCVLHVDHIIPWSHEARRARTI